MLPGDHTEMSQQPILQEDKCFSTSVNLSSPLY